MASQNKRPFSEEDFPALGATTPERAVHPRADPNTNEQPRWANHEIEDKEDPFQNVYGSPLPDYSASAGDSSQHTLHRSRVEAKEFLYATNVEPGGEPNQKAFWAVLPAYGALLPESAVESFVLDSRCARASLVKATCKHEKTTSGDTVWTFSRAGFSNQVVLAKPEKLRAAWLRSLDFAMIAAAAATSGAVAVIIVEPDKTKIDDIGCLLSKPSPHDDLIRKAVGALAIPVAVIHTNIGKKMDDAMNAVRGVGQLQVFTRLASETRTFENGTRTDAGGSPPLKPLAMIRVAH